MILDFVEKFEKEKSSVWMNINEKICVDDENNNDFLHQIYNTDQYQGFQFLQKISELM